MDSLTSDLLESIGCEPVPMPLQVQEAIVPVTANVSEVISAAGTNLDFLAGLSLPTVYEYAFPPIYLSIWKLLLDNVHKDREFPQIALGFPRGFAKTTFMKLFITYCILYTQKKFILVVSSTDQKAVNIVSDVMDMLSVGNIVSVFGNWKEGKIIERTDLKKFSFRGRLITLMPISIYGDVRGINLNHMRPDFMLFDDIQSKDVAQSKVLSDQLEELLYGTFMKAKSARGCMFSFIGNMYPTPNSLLRRITKNPNWIKFVVGGILADGTSLWEQLQPIKQLLKEYENDVASGHPEIFLAEVLNDDEAGNNTKIRLSDLPEFKYALEEVIGKFVVIDPATDKANADAVSIGLFELYATGLAYPTRLVKVIEGRFSPLETIKLATKLCISNSCYNIFVEGNAYQQTLCFWFDKVLGDIGIAGIHVTDIYSGKTSKTTRILNMFKELESGELSFNDECKPPVYYQITRFNFMRNDNIDGILDLLTYAPKIASKYAQYIASSNVIDAQSDEYALVDNSAEYELAAF